MNTHDPRDELAARAERPEADPRAPTEVVAGRVRAMRRRALAAAGAAVAAAVVVGVVVGVVSWRGLTDGPVPVPAATPTAESMPSRVAPGQPGDVVKDGRRYRAQVGDDRLAVGFIGDQGQGEFSVSWSPQSRRVTLGGECYLPGLDPQTAKHVTLRLYIEGSTGFADSQCRAEPPLAGDLPVPGRTSGEVDRPGSELAVGDPAVLHGRLIDTRTSESATFDTAWISGAVYELGEERVIEDDSGRAVGVLAAVVEHQGFAYRLDDVVTRRVGTGSFPQVPTPGGVPFLVTYGSTTPAGDPTVAALQLVGLDTTPPPVQGGRSSTVPQPARPPGTVELRIEDPLQRDGMAFVAIYTPRD